MSRATAPAVDQELIGRLRLAVARLARLLRQQDESGLTPTATAVLATIARRGPLTLGELAAAEQVAPPTITKIIARLEFGGLIERLADAGDRRVCRVVLSADGARQLDANRTRRTVWLAEQIADLPIEDQARLADAVAVLEHLTNPPEGEPR